MYSKLRNHTKLALLKFVSAIPEIDSLGKFLPEVRTSIRDRRLSKLKKLALDSKLYAHEIPLNIEKEILKVESQNV